MIQPNFYKYISLYAHHQNSSFSSNVGKALAGDQLLLATTFNTRISRVQESIINTNQRASFKVREFASLILITYILKAIRSPELSLEI